MARAQVTRYVAAGYPESWGKEGQALATALPSSKVQRMPREHVDGPAPISSISFCLQYGAGGNGSRDDLVEHLVRHCWYGDGAGGNMRRPVPLVLFTDTIHDHMGLTDEQVGGGWA